MIAEVSALAERLIVGPNIIAGACGNETTAAENDSDDNNDQGGVVLFGFFNDRGHLLVHDFYSSYGMNGMIN